MLDPDQPAPDQIGFLLLPRFSLMAFTSALEPLRIANRAAGRELYQWRICSVDGQPVQASNGLSLLVDAAFRDMAESSALIVVASFEPEQHLVPSTLAHLRRLARFGAEMGALDTGAWLLAAAGLLDGYKITLHWEAVPAFALKYPNTEISPRLYEVDRDRFTSAGGTSSFDMMLHLIGQRHGETLTRSITEQLVAGSLRPADLPQRPASSACVHDHRLARLLDAIEAEPTAGWSLATMAGHAHVSRRRLLDLFRQETGTSPHRFVHHLRLQVARSILETSDRSVRDVSLDCGFASLEHFSRSFRRRYGVAPSMLR